LTVSAVLLPSPQFGGESWIHGHRFL
jgi:hypothetical protein